MTKNWWLTHMGVVVVGFVAVGAVACADPSTDKSSGADSAAEVDPGGDDAGSDGMGGTEDSAIPCDEGLDIGQCPPDLPLVDGDGTEHAFSDYRGRPVLILGTAEW